VGVGAGVAGLGVADVSGGLGGACVGGAGVADVVGAGSLPQARVSTK
jgi:hypothetical protein